MAERSIMDAFDENAPQQVSRKVGPRIKNDMSMEDFLAQGLSNQQIEDNEQ
jgi:hypothetical protein